MTEYQTEIHNFRMSQPMGQFVVQKSHYAMQGYTLYTLIQIDEEGYQVFQLSLSYR